MAKAQSEKHTPLHFDAASFRLTEARSEIAKKVIGQDQVIDQTLITLAAGGHVLLMGVPGLAKTLLVETTAQVLGLHSARVQCTPDLMPSDIIGSEILEETEKGKRSFRFLEGPIFTQFFMADEINRASPRTQSALLQAMQEKEVSVGGQPLALPTPFHVLATQNPIEQEGTYPLPEAQLDRFMMQINVDYPDEQAEREIVIATTTNQDITPKTITTPQELMDIQYLVRDMPVGKTIVDMIIALVRNLRPGENASELVNEYVNWAPGPRAAQALMLGVRARSMLQGRSAPVEEDVFALANPILRHRMALNFGARAQNITLENVISETIESL